MGAKHLADYDIFTEQIVPGEHNKTYHLVLVTCTEPGCENSDAVNFEEGEDPAFYVTAFRQLRWNIQSDKKAMCPNCFGLSRLKYAVMGEPMPEAATDDFTTEPATPAPLPQPEEVDMTQTNGEPPAIFMPSALMHEHAIEWDKVAGETNPVPKTRAEKTRLADTYLKTKFVLLGDKLGCFVEGASDTEGSLLSGLTVAQFVEIREEDYGQLLNLGEIKNQAEELTATLDAMAGALARDIALFEKRYTEVQKLDAFGLNAFLAEERAKSERAMFQLREQMEQSLSKLQSDIDTVFAELVDRGQEKLTELHLQKVSLVEEPLADLKGRAEEVARLKEKVEDFLNTMPKLG